ncbi:GAF and ANTAR domain-containing protein [Candidatus Blastococcus massiliensis]|uniref:GAF and ANTAR domain-containing protein n=1 Tax=Candidatus Blastococcus massiliensis TaxID=1470358 RepID=UPI0004ACEF56|nr:GAF and ANTAR domain-containing protein [Candidatus Blastococcus massiliensis]
MTTDIPSPRPLEGARDAFAELGRVSFENTSMEDLLQRVAELAKQVIPGVAEASVSLVVHDRPTTVGFTGPLALDLDESQYGYGYGPCLEAAVGQEIREMTDAREERRWPEYTQVCIERGSLSSLSVPAPIRESIQAAVNLYAREAHAFDDVARDTGREFASYAALAVGNMHLYETTREWALNLDAAMRSRAVIEQAKGILMSQRRCDAAEAFNMLAAASQRSDRKLRDIAQSLVDGVSGTSHSQN